MKTNEKKTMLRMLAVVLSAVLLIGAMVTFASAYMQSASAAGFSGGNGSVSNPYVITTAAQLKFLADTVNSGNYHYAISHYRLGADINLSAYNWVPIGSGYYHWYGGHESGVNSSSYYGYATSAPYYDHPVTSYSAKSQAPYFDNSVHSEYERQILDYDSSAPAYDQSTPITNSSWDYFYSAPATSSAWYPYDSSYYWGGSSEPWYPGDSSWDDGSYPYYYNDYSFRGTFDGAGRTISGLTITESYYYSNTNTGLFGIIDNGTVKNVKLAAASMQQNNWYYSNRVGGIAGTVTNNGAIENCSVSGTIKGNSYTGGIAGYLTGGSAVTGCSVTAEVIGSWSSAGGIAGVIEDYGIVENCFTTGSVSGEYNVGGIVGSVSTYGYYYHSSMIKNCWTSGAVLGQNSVGGIAGNVNAYYYANEAVVKNCAALNSVVKGLDEVGRVVGSAYIYHYSYGQNANLLSGNVAFSGMGTGGGRAFTLGAEAAHDRRDGRSVGGADLQTSSGFPSGFTYSPWTYTSGKLPGLSGLSVDMPAHLSSSAPLEKGDVNGDGKIDAIDASLVLQYDARLITLTNEAIAAADVNGDGKADAIDASLILQYDARLIPDFNTPIQTGTNYARMATYKVWKNGVDDGPEMYYGVMTEVKIDDYRDDDCRKLNDGVVARGDDMDANGMTPMVNVAYVGTGATFHHVFTLDKHYDDIKTIVFGNVRDGAVNGNNRGWDDKIFVYVSDDGVNWGNSLSYTGPIKVPVPGAPEIQSKKVPGENNVENKNITYTLTTPAKGKYVKIIIGGGGGTAYILQLDEIEIRN